jgi:hypothetical protein
MTYAVTATRIALLPMGFARETLAPVPLGC